MTVAWLVPGQGAQHVGMASPWMAASPRAREALDEAGEVLGFDLVGLMRDGPAEVLDDTYNAQPALLATSVAMMRAAADDLPEPAMVAGHSMGEFSALVAAGAITYSAALLLVRERGRLMRAAGRASPGAMVAVLGLEDAAVEAVCDAIDGVQVANYNAPGQVVVSGAIDAVELAGREFKTAGARKVVRLAVSIAAHSALMAPVADEFRGAVEATPIAMARPPLVANSTAAPVAAPHDLRQELAGSLGTPVRWRDSIEWMRRQGVRHFVEVGPGSVLSGLVRRIARGDGHGDVVVEGIGSLVK
ncbi:MAG: ACP S-malonyltransferase [Anaerolineae bacterium]